MSEFKELRDRIHSFSVRMPLSMTMKLTKRMCVMEYLRQIQPLLLDCISAMAFGAKP